MAAGGMLRAGLGRALGPHAGVSSGADLATSGLGQEPRPRPSSKDPFLFWPPNATPAPESTPGSLLQPHPLPIAQSVHHHFGQNRRQPEKRPPRVQLLWDGEGRSGCVFSSLGSSKYVQRGKDTARRERTASTPLPRG